MRKESLYFLKFNFEPSEHSARFDLSPYAGKMAAVATQHAVGALNAFGRQMDTYDWQSFEDFTNVVYLDAFPCLLTGLPGRDLVFQQTEAVDEMDIEEDKAFISCSTTDATIQKPAVEPLKQDLADVNHELEEDVAFLQPVLPRTAVPFQDHAHVGYDDTCELDEDSAFIAPSSSRAIPSSPMFTTLPAGHVNNAMSSSTVINPVSEAYDYEGEESLPSATQLIRSITGRDIDVTRFQLGIQSDAGRQIFGTMYNGRKITFRRQKGNALIGEVCFKHILLKHRLTHLTLMHSHVLTADIPVQLARQLCRYSRHRYTSSWKA